MSATTSSAADPLDTSLGTLVPEGTRRRNAALIILAVLAVVIAWFSPNVLAPRLNDAGWAGSVGAGAADRTMAATVTTTPRVWPWATVAGVDDMPGATVIGAWLMRADDVRRALADSPAEALVPDQPYAGMQGLALAFPADMLDRRTALPQRVSPGREITLAVLWRVDDCDALDPSAVPVVRLRSALGTTSSATLNEMFSPSRELARDSLRVAEICP